MARGKSGLENALGSDEGQQDIAATLNGTVSTIGTAASASVSRSVLLKRYERLRHEQERVEGILGLELETFGRAYPRQKKLGYMSVSAAQGGAAAAASLVSEAGAVVGGVAGVGAGGVPGTLARCRPCGGCCSLATGTLRWCGG
jgi:hypothetical protein